MDLNRYKKNLPKRREAGTWLEPRRYEKEIYLLERLALETCFQKCFAVSGLFIEKQWRLFFTSFVVDKISIRENCDQNVYTGLSFSEENMKTKGRKSDGIVKK